ncbi:hypothetical protein K491DRAFT_581603, partial [Lophiostoma macrostomum CBS 122681]
LNLSRTCKVLHILVAPLFFRSLVLRNSEKSGSSVLAVTKSPHAQHEQQLRYCGTIAMPESNVMRVGPEGVDSEPAAPDPSDFPEAVEEVLSHLARFPRLETLTMEFKWDPESEDDEEAMMRGFYNFDDEEDDEECEEAEEEYAWRALMARSYSAVVKNTGTVPTLRCLELKDVVPRAMTVWKTPGFGPLLSQLEDFKISLRGGTNGDCGCLPILMAWPAFVESLETLIFDHLCNVQTFELGATWEGPPGLKGMRHVTLPLSSDQMPKLRVLKFRRCFIGPPMRDFISSHAATLESIELEDCASGFDSGLADDAITWAELFDRISRAGFRQLKEVIIPPTDVPLEYGADERSSPLVDLNELPANSRLFSYKSLDDKYGFAMDNEDANFAAYEGGEDQAAWDRLLAVLEEN